MITLRADDQLPVVERLRESLRSNQFTMLQAATGFGKTVVASHMAKGASDKNKRIIFGVHRRELARQTSRTFDRFGIEHGFIMSGVSTSPKCKVQIASADTLINRPDDQGCDWFIPDEAHLWASAGRHALITAVRAKGAKGVGLSATPERLDGKPMDDLFDDMVCGPEVGWLMDHGRLAQYRAYAPITADLSGIRKRGGDYAVDDLEERFNKPAIIGDAVRTYQKLAAGLRCMVFAISKIHGKALLAGYGAAGIHAVYIDGDTPQDVREARIAAFADLGGVLISILLCIEGFDLAAQIGRDVPVQAVSLQNPTASVPRFLQMCGRGLRPWDGLSVLMDHWGGFAQHGFPETERAWSLAGRDVRRKSEAVPAISTCSKCFGAFRTAPECPYCHTARKLTPREVERRDGQLAEIERDRQARAKKVAMWTAERSADDTREGKIKGMIQAARQAGYKLPGWVIMRAKIKGIPNVTYAEVVRLMR